MTHIVHEHDLPKPDTLIQCKNGDQIAAMFYYALPDHNLRDIAESHGFLLRSASMFDQLSDEHPLVREYEDGSADVVERWHPEEPEGWTFGGKHDTDDGPVAWFICKKEPICVAAVSR